MNLKFFVLLLALLIANPGFAADANLASDKAKISYSIGMQVGSQLANSIKQDELDVDAAALLLAIQDMLAGKPPRLTNEEFTTAMNLLRDQQMQKQSKLAEENKIKGETFLVANKSKPGVKVLPSGVQYKVIKSGSGQSPTASDSVVAHYRGTLVDGTEFDSSISRGQPATFPVNGVIRGWQEILQKMKVGDKWEVYIPSELGYGARGTSGIGPNSALIFEIDLLEVK